MKKQSSGKKGFGPGLDGNHDDKRGNGRTAAHPQAGDEDEEDEYVRGRLDTSNERRGDIEDYEGDEDMGVRAKQGREDLEDDSLEGTASRQQRSIRSGRDEETDDELLPVDPKSTGKPSNR
ncbi:MAG: hypothetical protein ACAH80_18845 [Alphaproteobacteria bacterium]